MSSEGGLSNKEYGGAHEKHANGFDVNNVCGSDIILEKTRVFCDKNNGDQILAFQDGDIESVDKDTDSENLSFLAGDELDSFKTDSHNNSDWLKGQCRNEESINFSIPASSSDDIDLFEASVGELAGGDPGTSLCSDVSAHIFISPLNNSVFSANETNLVVSSSSSIENNVATAVSHNSNKIPIADNPAGVSDVSQDPITGSDVVNLKHDIRPSAISSNPSFPLIGQVSMDVVSCTSKSEQTVLLAPINSNQPQLIHATAIPQTIQIITPQPTMIPQGNLKFATISISTDKPSNSTHILVNTNQGNQLYKLNTADLKQATNALKPLDGTVSQQSTSNPQTGYLLLNPEPTSNGIVNFIQMDATGQNLIQMDGTPPKVFLSSVENKKVFMCPVEGCEKMFRRLSKYKTHQMRHTGERPFKCSKPGCEWAFTTHYKLKRHEESHEGKKSYMCPIPDCGGKFTTVYNLNSHIKLHDRPCTEVCPVKECALKFATKRQLDAHMKSHAGHEKTYKCPHEGCDKVFISPLSMGSHPRVHLHNKDDLTCKFEGCGKVFDKTCRLNQHMRSHTGEKPYICFFEGCNWAFTTASKLKRHQAKHTGVRKWVCDVCGKAFMRSEHLKGHKVTHSGDKPFACPIEGCDIKFTAKSSLFVHIKKHENGGKKVMYHCPMEGCLKKYSNKPSLRAHIVKHVKQVMSDNNNTQTEPSNLDMMPYLDNDLPDIGILASIEASNSTVTETQNEAPAANPQSTPVTETPSAPVMIDPSEFIASSGVSETSFITTENGEVQQISPEVINQILSSMERQDQIVGSLESELSKLTDGITTTASIRSHGKEKGNSAKSGGSARTDYHANQLMSERAKKRRTKEATTAVTENAFQDLSEKNNFMTNSFDSGDGMTSRGITFRDPETGVLYLQTQLLQDDPPNTDLYCDDGDISTDLTSSHPVTSCTPLNESATIPEFTGSTINLQDLE